MADVRRADVEPMYEEMLVGLVRELVVPEPPQGQPDTRKDEDLRHAEAFFPGFFGGEFPTAGIAVTTARGENEALDKRHLPDVLGGELRVYYPSQPIRGAGSRQEDLTGEAKRVTRVVRNRILEKLMGSKLGPFLYVAESAGGDRNAVGIAQAEEPSRRNRHILWVDRTEFEIKVAL